MILVGLHLEQFTLVGIRFLLNAISTNQPARGMLDLSDDGLNHLPQVGSGELPFRQEARDLVMALGVVQQVGEARRGRWAKRRNQIVVYRSNTCLSMPRFYTCPA